MSEDQGTQPQSMTIKAAEQAFAALSWGEEGAPVVLALHGWLDNAASFNILAPMLKGYRIIALDLAGHGLSDHRGQGADYPIWSYVPDVISVMDSLDLEQVHLLGHSMGAIVSSILASACPERVLTLSLIDGLWPVPGEVENVVSQLKRAVEHRARISGRAKNNFPTIDMAVRARRMGFGRISSAAAELIVRRGIKEDNGGWIWRSDSRLLAPAGVRFTLDQARKVVAEIKMPTLLLVASQGILPELVEKNKSRLLHINIVTLDGDHHLHMEEGAEPAAKLIQAHLDKVQSV
ncbi:alpha/beta hydrolase [Sansalvadorimonas sp. 2012CJ34-2]|uniref:Alpha/beta hydrolase n=1 Tax=Parendozoicomonas callyspongiae TaxID=2942213 RepID=A0ABT0PB99_9GAMM|nr:alpha/beta hydrolase [Sansalvadorimonas sp. 2012CJ34-2]MCL6268662.1 alpha/beta hydrolase [Sansalvadorimonas sp. 2012CJ34-2]